MSVSLSGSIATSFCEKYYAALEGCDHELVTEYREPNEFYDAAYADKKCVKDRVKKAKETYEKCSVDTNPKRDA